MITFKTKCNFVLLTLRDARKNMLIERYNEVLIMFLKYFLCIEYVLNVWRLLFNHITYSERYLCRYTVQRNAAIRE